MSDSSILAVTKALMDAIVKAEKHSHVSTNVHSPDPEPSVAEKRAEMRQMKQQIEQLSQFHSVLCMELASLCSGVHTIRTDMVAVKPDVMNHLKTK